MPTTSTTAIHNGFAILAPTVCFVTPQNHCPLDGFGVGAHIRNNVAVLNGTVRGFGFEGVKGIFAGDGSMLLGNTAQGNGGSGIAASHRVTVHGNTAWGNGETGISASDGSTVRGNTAQSNAGFGLDLEGRTGYTHNVLSANAGGSVAGGTSLGQNLCNGAVC